MVKSLNGEEQKIGERAYRAAVRAGVPCGHRRLADAVLLVARNPLNGGMSDARLVTAVRSYLGGLHRARRARGGAGGGSLLPAVLPDYQTATHSLDDPVAAPAAEYELCKLRAADADAIADDVEASLNDPLSAEAQRVAVSRELGDVTALAAAALDLGNSCAPPIRNRRAPRASRAARSFRNANAALIRETAERFYGELKRRCPSLCDVRQAGLALLDQDPTLRRAGLLVAGAVPRFFLRLAPAGGGRDRPRVTAAQIVQPDVHYCARSLTSLHYGSERGDFQLRAALSLWPRRRPRRTVRQGRPAGALSIGKLLALAKAGAESPGAQLPSEFLALKFDLIDDTFMRLLYRGASKSGGPGRAAAAFAGAIDGRREMPRRLHLPRADVCPRSTFTLRLRLRSAMGEESDPLWGVALRKAMRHLGWFHGMSADPHKIARSP
jgi:hypothetical protein